MLEALLARYVELDDRFYIALASGTLSWSLLGTGRYEPASTTRSDRFSSPPTERDIGGATFGIREVQIVFHLLGALRPAAILEGAFDYLTIRYGIIAPPAFSEFTRRIWPGSEALRNELGAEAYEALRSTGAAMTLDEIAALIDESVSEFGMRDRQCRPPTSHRLSSHGTPASPRPSLRRRARRVRRGRGPRGLRRRRAHGRSPASAPSSRRSRPARPSPASSRSRTSSTARSARTTTCCSSTTSHRRRGRRAGPALPRGAARPAADDIERVYSHIQALGQAEAFLRARPWQLLTTYNTAGAGKSIVENGERGAAAVLSPRAAALFGLEILANDIRRPRDNRTRFLVLAPPGTDVPAARDGARTVGRRSSSRSATSRARSSPCSGVRAPRPEHEQARVPAEPRAAWEYVFWVDLDADGSDPAMRPHSAISGVTTMLRVLGSYARGEGG